MNDFFKLMHTPFEDAQVKCVYDEIVARPFVSVGPVPPETQHLHQWPRQQEGKGQSGQTQLLLPQVEAHTADHWWTTESTLPSNISICALQYALCCMRSSLQYST